MNALLLAFFAMQAGTIGPALPGDPMAVPTLPPPPARSAGAPLDAAPAPEPAHSGRLERCLAALPAAAAEALSAGDAWLREAQGPLRAEAQHCRGMALIGLGRHQEAREAFSAGQAAVANDDLPYRARLLALAGNAALLGADAAAALPLLEQARSVALASGEQELAFSVQLDAATARAQLGQLSEARASLAAARALQPRSAEVLLLSAVLARAAGDLAEAQTLITEAAALAPREPRVALEAGVIAAMAGQPEAAARSWRSVVALAPGTDAARTAENYLAQFEDTGAQDGTATR
ncbi:hypothetical protein EYB45_02360 [Erythrobacteraceae bacterium CFH 75059]|uniref:hypothetical protein n=1 Tax=Qipengyuania thermophila TaxID=2509361 RepID=UPI0010205768|nr:hypothetical protein [Qipengyuania thermophila]TCD06574.1 hypothetical protein EYB45_02360 [Erythrobacteraceae bacterium CFH 75059]